jgi:hypothetical protein
MTPSNLSEHTAIIDAVDCIALEAMVCKDHYGDRLDKDEARRIIADAVAKVCEPYKMALEAVAAGIWRDKERNACGLAGGSIVVDLVEAALNPNEVSK